MSLGTTWNLPNYSGELFTADPTSTPLLSMIGGILNTANVSGGITGGIMTRNWEFPTAQLFEYPDAEQPNISEAASATAPPASHIDRAQQRNVVQIHQKTIDLTYHKLANTGRMQGINTAGQAPNPIDELAWQIQNSMLTATARDVEYSFIRGTFQSSVNVNTANRTRGMLEVCRDFGTSIDATNEPLSFNMLQGLYRAMADAGAYFGNMVMFVPARLKQTISNLYASLPGGTLPATRTQGGINITDIMTDFTNIQVIWNRAMPADTILICDISYMSPVFLEVPGKGVLFVEPLAKEGASERYQMYGEIGLDHGPGFLHGAITNIGA